MQGSHYEFVGHSNRDLGSDSEVNGSRSQQGKNREYSVPLHETWTKILGIYERDLRAGRDGAIYIRSNPGPAVSSDFSHVALASAARGASLSDGQSPLAPADKSEEIEVGGQVSCFPYLRLVPPHCDSCQCQ